MGFFYLLLKTSLPILNQNDKMNNDSPIYLIDQKNGDVIEEQNITLKNAIYITVWKGEIIVDWLKIIKNTPKNKYINHMYIFKKNNNMCK